MARRTRNRQDGDRKRAVLIIEGDYLPKEWRKDFEEDDPVASHALVMSPEYVTLHKDDIVRFRHVVERRRHEMPHIPDLVGMHEATYLRCLRYGDDVTVIDASYEEAFERTVVALSALISKPI